MIIKELDEYIGNTAWEKNGRKAEETMSFYLNRKFHDNANIHIINNIRFETCGGYAQIDHLAVSRYGMVIVESKSVTSILSYDDRGEWSRKWNNSWQGMKNPVIQAQYQADALRELLQNNRENLLGKFFGIKQKGFKFMPIQCIVAVSDTGSIWRKGKKDIYSDNVFKADMVADKIIEIYGKTRKNDTIFGKSDLPWKIEAQERDEVIRFLLSSHTPLIMKETPIPEEKNTEVPQEIPTVKQEDVKHPKQSSPQIIAEKEDKIESLKHCPECKGRVSILWGNKYKSYYWHCNDCGKNISINYKCPQCKDKLKICKKGGEYQIYCEPCNLEALYFADIQV